MAVEKESMTHGIEEYLEAIWRVAGKGPAATKDLAEHLGVAPPSVTGMLKRLAGMGLVDYAPYGKASLSAKGRKLASQVIRRHRLSERMLTDLVGLPWEQAHEEACRFEHLITGEVEARLAQRLGDIETCPHGHPLDLAAASDAALLSDIEAPAWVEVVAIEDESAEFLGYLTKLGILPGTRMRVTGREPFAEGGVLVEVGKKPHALSREAAARIKVTISKGASRR